MENMMEQPELTPLGATPELMSKRATQLANCVIEYVQEAKRAFADAEKQGSLSAMLVLFNALKNANKELDEARTQLGSFVEMLNKTALPKQFETRGIDMARVPEIGRSFYITTQYTATVRDKDLAFAWLKENGGEDLIQPTVNAGTLKSFVKSKIEEDGIDPPEEAITFSNYSTIGSSKYTPK